MTRPTTYLDDNNTAVDLHPAKMKIVFKARLDHGPGFFEDMIFLVGPSKCETYDVLWIQSDQTDGVSAAAWLPRGIVVGPVLWRWLLIGYWKAEERANPGCGPNYSEIVGDACSLASAQEITQVEKEVWPAA